MDEIPDVLDQLKAACVGHPHAKIAWPHRLLHSAIAEIEQLRAALLAEREAATKAEREYIADFVEAKMSDVDPEYGTFIATAIRSGARP